MSAALQVAHDAVDSAAIAAALGVKKRAIEARAARAAWPYTTSASRGGPKRWYLVSSLPTDVQRALDIRDAKAAARARIALAQAALPAPAPAADAAPTAEAPAAPLALPAARPVVPTGAARVMHGQTRRVARREDLCERDRAILDAVLLLCLAVDEARGAGACSARVACAELARRIHAGAADADLIQAARTSYQRPRRSTEDPHGVGLPGPLAGRLERLYGFYLAGVREGDAARYLAPAKVKAGLDAMRHADKLAFLAHYCKPARPRVKQAWAASLAWYEAHGIVRPAVDVFYRLEKLFPVKQKHRGRMTGSAWRAVMPHRARDVSMFSANDIWVGDGHTFKASVLSPIHGKAFRPEVTVVLDWRSRKVVGWSVDLAESTLAVSAAFRDAQLRTRGVPLVYYSDNGSGQTGKLIDCDITGTLARQGIAHETGIPGNPQGRGVIERLWPSTLIELASRYPTFMHERADAETVRKTALQIAKDQKHGFSAIPPRFDVFLADLEECFAAYNARAHRAIGKRTPDAEYAATLDADSIVFGAGDGEIAALWLPELQRTPRRGLIEMFGNKYSLPGLVDVLPEGERVRVRFDIHRPEQVWVLDMDGRQLGIAKWDGHKSAAFPVSYIETKRIERVERKVTKKLAEADAARDELMQTFDAAPALLERAEPEPLPGISAIVAQPRSREPEPRMRDPLETQEYIRQVARETQAKQAAAAAAAPEAGGEESPAGDDLEEVATG